MHPVYAQKEEAGNKKEVITITRVSGADGTATKQDSAIKSNNQTRSVLDVKIVPVAFKAYAAYPNPFTKETRLSYRLPQDGMVKITLSDLNGRILKTWTENKTRGTQVFIWDGTDDSNNILPAGLYFCTIEYNGVKKVSRWVKN